MASILLTQASRTASGTSDPVKLSSPLQRWLAGALFHLHVTTAATEAGDLLDLYLQHSADGGNTWTDFVRFTQVLGNDSMPKNYFGHWVALISPTSAMHAVQDGAMSAGVNQGPIGQLIRVKWVITAAATSGNESFNFGVYYSPVFA